ncbi:MAG: TraR/DksA C4-type zinc finger protein [Caldicoprobacterales bacterium]|nr:conjugal transfer protein TraR [Clostridiales bacterium]
MQKHGYRYFKNKLEKMLDDKSESLSIHKEISSKDSLRNSTNELSFYDNHPADTGSETYEMEKQFTLSRHQARQVDEVKAALERIGKGSYGYCESCGKSIAFERLDVIPETRFCMDCEEEKAGASDMKYDRPAEEDLLESPFYRTFQKEDSVLYDGEDALQDTQKYGSSSGPQDISVNDRIDYQHTWYESHEDVGYVEDVENISNETYRQQLPEIHGGSYDGYVKPKKEIKIHYFGEEEQEAD